MDCFIALAKGRGVLKMRAALRDPALRDPTVPLGPAESWVMLAYLCTLLWEPPAGRHMKTG